MANSTYLELTNELLRRLLEGQLTSTDFASARSTQATAKDCIRAAIKEIDAKEREWPYQYETGTQLLVVGTTEYNFPTTLKQADWESFYIVKDDALSVNTTPLGRITRDIWMKKYRPLDLDAGSDGRGTPVFVFDSSKSKLNSFGVTPSPDQAFTIGYEYYVKETELVDHDDETTIPQEFDYVIINVALKHFYMHKDNSEQVSVWLPEVERSINHMRHTLMPKKDDVSDTRVNFGGSTWRGSLVGGRV